MPDDGDQPNMTYNVTNLDIDLLKKEVGQRFPFYDWVIPFIMLTLILLLLFMDLLRAKTYIFIIGTPIPIPLKITKIITENIINIQ